MTQCPYQVSQGTNNLVRFKSIVVENLKKIIAIKNYKIKSPLNHTNKKIYEWNEISQ